MNCKKCGNYIAPYVRGTYTHFNDDFCSKQCRDSFKSKMPYYPDQQYLDSIADEILNS